MSDLNKYIKFICFRNSLKNAFKFDDRDCLILEFIAKKNEQNHPCTVTELINEREIGSPAIVHASFKQLIRDGYVFVKLDQNDHRIKYLSLTSNGNLIQGNTKQNFQIKGWAVGCGLESGKLIRGAPDNHD